MVLKVLRAWSPWSPADGFRWVAAGLLGIAVCGAAWWLASREAHFGHQIRWAALGAGGFLIVAYADVTWLLRARWSIIRRRQQLLPDEPEASTDEAPGQVHAGVVVAGPGLDHFHRPDCPLATGKEWPESRRDVALAAGKRPCGMCEP